MIALLAGWAAPADEPPRVVYTVREPAPVSADLPLGLPQLAEGRTAAGLALGATQAECGI